MGLKAGWLAFFVFVWLVGAYLGSTFEFHDTEADWAGTGTGGYDEKKAPVTTLKYLMDISNAVQRYSVLGNIPLPIPNGEYFQAAFDVLTWKFSFLYNPDGTMAYGMFYWLLLAPFTVMGVLSMVLIVFGIITGNLTLS